MILFDKIFCVRFEGETQYFVRAKNRDDAVRKANRSLVIVDTYFKSIDNIPDGYGLRE